MQSIRKGGWFPLSAANGLEIPYIGVALVDMLVFGQSIKQVGFLVTKETPEMKLSKDDYSGILGMNVLSNISKLSTIFSKSGVNMMRQEVKLNDKSNFVKVSSCVPVQVPSRSVVDVKVQCAGKGVVLVEPLHGALPGNF